MYRFFYFLRVNRQVRNRDVLLDHAFQFCMHSVLEKIMAFLWGGLHLVGNSASSIPDGLEVVFGHVRTACRLPSHVSSPLPGRLVLLLALPVLVAFVLCHMATVQQDVLHPNMVKLLPKAAFDNHPKIPAAPSTKAAG